MKSLLLVTDKQTGKKALYTKLTTLARRYGYEYDNLIYHFSRKGKGERFEDDARIIERVDIIR